MPENPRARLIHIDVDRRLGHEWDEWDGRPLPNRGDYDASPALFFGWSAATLAAFFAAGALALYLLALRGALLHRRLLLGGGRLLRGRRRRATEALEHGLEDSTHLHGGRMGAGDLSLQLALGQGGI